MIAIQGVEAASDGRPQRSFRGVRHAAIVACLATTRTTSRNGPCAILLEHPMIGLRLAPRPEPGLRVGAGRRGMLVRE